MRDMKSHMWLATETTEDMEKIVELLHTGVAKGYIDFTLKAKRREIV